MRLIAVEFNRLRILLIYFRMLDTKRNTVHRFMIAKYGMQETHSIVLIQRLNLSYKQTVSSRGVGCRQKEATYRQNHRKRVTRACIALPSALSARDLH